MLFSNIVLLCHLLSTVVPDHLISQLRITNADIVIHFDLPNSKTKFGNRLALMLDHFCGERQVSDDDNNSSTCEVSVSYHTMLAHCYFIIYYCCCYFPSNAIEDNVSNKNGDSGQ